LSFVFFFDLFSIKKAWSHNLGHEFAMLIWIDPRLCFCFCFFSFSCFFLFCSLTLGYLVEFNFIIVFGKHFISIGYHYHLFCLDLVHLPFFSFFYYYHVIKLNHLIEPSRIYNLSHLIFFLVLKHANNAWTSIF
jgi:hypothetical protein